MVLALVAPGQGAQTPGFLTPWLQVPEVAELLTHWSSLAGCDLIRYGTTGTAEEITDTAITQPLLVGAAMAVGLRLAASPAALADGVGVVAGHSVGELAAGALAGILSPDQAMTLIGVRGQAMAKASIAEQTGMTAILGGDTDAVLARIERYGLTPANINGAGQIVAAGTSGRLQALADDPPPGARLRQLQVAGAFHTAHMASAVAALSAAASEITPRDPVMTILSNRDGAGVRSGADWLTRIVSQVSLPVRWDLCMAAMSRLGVSAIIELPPAGTLAGLARRAMPGVKPLAIKSPDDLDEARALLAEHGNAHGDHHTPDWRLLVAAEAGTLRLPEHRAAPGALIAAGAELGRVQARHGDQPVAPQYPATLIEWLAEDGDPVNSGQPLVRLTPRTDLFA